MKLEKKCEYALNLDNVYFCQLKTNEKEVESCTKLKDYETCIVYTINKYRNRIMKFKGGKNGKYTEDNN